MYSSTEASGKQIAGGNSHGTVTSTARGNGRLLFYDQYGTIIYGVKVSTFAPGSCSISDKSMPNRKNLCARFLIWISRLQGLNSLHYCWNLKRLRFICPRLIKPKKKEYPYVVSYSTDAEGYLVFHLEDAEKKKHKGQILSYHTSASSVRSVLGYMREVYLLCEEKIDGGAIRKCIPSNGECYGACAGIEDPEVYNERADQARQHLTKVFDSDFVLLRKAGPQMSKG